MYNKCYLHEYIFCYTNDPCQKEKKEKKNGMNLVILFPSVYHESFNFVYLSNLSMYEVH